MLHVASPLNSASFESPSNSFNGYAVTSLQGTWAESLLFARVPAIVDKSKRNFLWLHEFTSKVEEDTIPEGVEIDLTRKMKLIDANVENVYGGKRILEQMLKKLCEKHSSEKTRVNVPKQVFTIFQLLLALEIEALGDQDRAMEHLDKYCSALSRIKTPVHPLLLLAIYRIGMPLSSPPRSSQQPNKKDILLDFAKLVNPDMLELLSEEEHDLLESKEHSCSQTDFSSDNNKASASLMISAGDAWESLKDTNGLKSDAMEELLQMTGLRKVKQTAVDLFKQGLVLSSMDTETRKLNSPTLNYVFYGEQLILNCSTRMPIATIISYVSKPVGNPGTGKTTVARLFARILHDAGLRKNHHFIECDGQGIKDAGVDDFKKKSTSAKDGVLFMDEAYTLDPVGDKFKGGPIANSLLLLAENQRDEISLILAGYEDELNDKLFAFNPGFKSRFTEVFFEDFDEEVC